MKESGLPDNCRYAFRTISGGGLCPTDESLRLNIAGFTQGYTFKVLIERVDRSGRRKAQLQAIFFSLMQHTPTHQTAALVGWFRAGLLFPLPEVLGMGVYAKVGDICLFQEHMLLETEDGKLVQIGNVFLSSEDMPQPSLWEFFENELWLDDEPWIEAWNEEENRLLEAQWIEPSKEPDYQVEVDIFPYHILTLEESGACIGLMKHLYPNGRAL